MLSIKEESAKKIQSVYRGYSIRKHFLAVRLRFERIVKSIEGNIEVCWKFNSLSFPVFKNPNLGIRLQEIESRRIALIKELRLIEDEIKNLIPTRD